MTDLIKYSEEEIYKIQSIVASLKESLSMREVPITLKNALESFDKAIDTYNLAIENSKTHDVQFQSIKMVAVYGQSIAQQLNKTKELYETDRKKGQKLLTQSSNLREKIEYRSVTLSSNTPNIKTVQSPKNHTLNQTAKTSASQANNIKHNYKEERDIKELDKIYKIRDELTKKSKNTYRLSLFLRSALGISSFISLMPDSTFVNLNISVYPFITTGFGLFAAILFVLIKQLKLQDTVENIDERLHFIHETLNKFADDVWAGEQQEFIKLEQSLYKIEAKLRKGLFDGFKHLSAEKSA